MDLKCGLLGRNRTLFYYFPYRWSPSEDAEAPFLYYSSKISNLSHCLLNNKLLKLLLELADDKQIIMKNSQWEDIAESREGHFGVKLSMGYFMPVSVGTV